MPAVLEEHVDRVAETIGQTLTFSGADMSWVPAITRLRTGMAANWSRVSKPAMDSWFAYWLCAQLNCASPNASSRSDCPASLSAICRGKNSVSQSSLTRSVLISSVNASSAISCMKAMYLVVRSGNRSPNSAASSWV